MFRYLVCVKAAFGCFKYFRMELAVRVIGDSLGLAVVRKFKFAEELGGFFAELQVLVVN